MIRKWGYQALVVLVVLVTLTMPITAVGIGTVHAASGPTTYELTDSIDVWERAPLPLRLSNEDAAKTITNGAFTVEYTPESTGPIPAREGRTGVYSPGTAVTATFESVTGAGTSSFNGNDTQLVIARLDPGADMNDLPTSIEDAQSILTTENADQNATFRVKDTGAIQDGELSTSISFSESGTYAVFLATVDSGSGFSATDGDLSVSGQVTIVGMDHALVEESAASTTINTNDINPGDDISITVDNLPATPTNVTVLVYEKSTWVNSETNLKITERVTRNLSAENVTIEHSITEMNGVANFEGAVTVLGTTFGDQRVSGSTPISTVLDALVTEADSQSGQDVTGPETTATGSTVLDASVTGKTGVTDSATVTIETFENWSTGQYQYVVLAGGSSTGDIRTDVGTLQISSPTDGTTPPTTTPPTTTPPTTTPPTTTPPTPPRQDPGTVKGAGPGAKVNRTASGVQVTLPRASANSQVQIDLTVTDDELNKSGVAVSQMRIGFSQNTSGSVTVRSESADNVTTDPVSEGGDLGYLRIDHNFSDTSVGEVTFTFRVSKQKLVARNLSPEDVSLYRSEPDGWNELPTTLINETANAYVYEAVSPGLSLYSISQKNAAQPNFEVTDSGFNPDTATVGEQIEITATIANTGDAPGNFTAELTIDGEVVSMQTVRIPANSQRTVTFTHTFDTAGTYRIDISGTNVGTVSITEQTTTTTTTSPGTTTTPTTTQQTTTGPVGQGEINWTAFAAVIFVLAAIAGLFLYRRRGE